MKTRAAIAVAAGKPLEVTEVDLDGPREGEVLIEVKATGICHTDEFTLSGADPEGLFPSILGHEGAGIVVDVGAGVTTLRKGDHVIPLYTPECRQCPSCLSRKTNLCTAIRTTQGQGLMPDGTSRFSCNGERVFHYMGCSTFSNFTVLPEIAVAKVNPGRALRHDLLHRLRRHYGDRRGHQHGKSRAGRDGDRLWPRRNRPQRHPGPAPRRGRHDHRRRPQRRKEAVGRALRHDAFRQPERVGGDLVPYLVNLTKRGADQIGGADYTFDCTGNTTVMRQALEASHRGWGQSIVIGVAGSGAGDLHPAVPSRHRPRLEGHRLRRRPGPHRRAEDRRLVPRRQDRDRPDDHGEALRSTRSTRASTSCTRAKGFAASWFIEITPPRTRRDDKRDPWCPSW